MLSHALSNIKCYLKLCYVFNYSFDFSSFFCSHRVGTFGLCNRPSPLLADIVLFELSLMGFPTRFLNTFARVRFPHPL